MKGKTHLRTLLTVLAILSLTVALYGIYRSYCLSEDGKAVDRPLPETERLIEQALAGAERSIFPETDDDDDEGDEVPGDGEDTYLFVQYGNPHN